MFERLLALLARADVDCLVIDALRDDTYDSGHARYVTRRREWFSAFGRPHYALWWIPEGSRPTPDEGRDRLDRLHGNGPSPHAFTFTTLLPAS